jgi:hypothetical protein
MKVFTVQLRTNLADTLRPVCFVPISSDGENGFVAFDASRRPPRVACHGRGSDLKARDLSLQARANAISALSERAVLAASEHPLSH